MPPLIPLSKLAKRVGVHPDTIRRGVEEGDIPPPVRGGDGSGKHWMFAATVADALTELPQTAANRRKEP